MGRRVAFSIFHSISRTGHTEDAEATHTQRHCMAPTALCNLHGLQHGKWRYAFISRGGTETRRRVAFSIFHSISRTGHTEDAEATHTQRHCMAPTALCNLHGLPHGKWRYAFSHAEARRRGAIPHFQFSIFNFQFSIFNFQFSILMYNFAK